MASYPPPFVAATNIELFNNIAFPGREASSGALSSAEEQELVDFLERALTQVPLNESTYAVSACFVLVIADLCLQCADATTPRSLITTVLHVAPRISLCIRPITTSPLTHILRLPLASYVSH